MESVSRSIDENVVRIAQPGQSAEVIWLEPRARLAERITRGAAAMAASPAVTAVVEPEIDTVSLAETAPELDAPTMPAGPLAALGGPQDDEPAVSADRIVTLIREQQALIGRILQNQSESVSASASSIDGGIPIALSAQMSAPGETLDLSYDPDRHLPAEQGAERADLRLMPSHMPQPDSIDNDRPPMIIERAQASQGMQLIGDLTTSAGHPRPTWPGFIAGMALAVVLGAVLYAKIAPSV